MVKRRIKNRDQLNQLQTVYNRAKSVCDPIEFVQRQQTLLYTIAEVLIEPIVTEQLMKNIENEK